MSFIKNKFRALYMTAFIIFTIIFTIAMPDGHTAMWFALLTALLGTVSTVMFAQKNIWAQILIITCYREQWFFWFVLDGISIVTFALISEWAMVAMYVCWFINTIYGWIEWSHNEKKAVAADTAEA